MDRNCSPSEAGLFPVTSCLELHGKHYPNRRTYAACAIASLTRIFHCPIFELHACARAYVCTVKYRTRFTNAVDGREAVPELVVPANVARNGNRGGLLRILGNQGRDFCFAKRGRSMNIQTLVVGKCSSKSLDCARSKRQVPADAGTERCR